MKTPGDNDKTNLVLSFKRNKCYIMMRRSDKEDVHRSGDHAVFCNVALLVIFERSVLLPCTALLFAVHSVHEFNKICLNLPSFSLVKMGKLSAEDRCEILLALQNNVSPTILKDKYHVSRQTIYKVQNMWKKERRIVTKKPPGPKRKITDGMIKDLIEKANSLPFATLEELWFKCELPCHLSWISAILLKEGLRSFVAKLKNPLTNAAKAKRIKFVKSIAERHEKLDYGRVVFTDEKTVQNFFNGRARVRRFRGQGLNQANIVKVDQQRNCKVNLWGYISEEKYDVFLVPNKFKSSNYKTLMETSFLPEIRKVKPNFIYMQDNASIHKAAIVTDYFKEQQLDVLDWPPRSPDLNPIENVWAEMQRLVNKHLLKNRIRKAEQLFIICKECFAIACEKMIPNLYKSVPKRLQQVIINRGERTRY